MSQENVEIARRAFEAAVRKPKPDFATLSELFHPDHKLVYPDVFTQDDEDAGSASDFLSTIQEAWGSWEGRLDRVSELDEERVLLVTTISVRGKRSGVPVEQRIAAVMTFKDRAVARTETYRSAEEALEAAGLAE